MRLSYHSPFRPRPPGDSLLVIGKKLADMKKPELRPLSRYEMAKLYNDSRGETARDKHDQIWRDELGVEPNALREKETDAAIVSEQLMFAQTDNLAPIKNLAE